MRILSLFVAVFLFASPLAALPAYAAGTGDLVKCPDFASVYFIGDDGKRYVFPNENIFFSWFADFDEVKLISCDDLASLPIGGTIVYQAGTSLVKLPSVPTVYVVEPDGVLRAIETEEQAQALFGDDWAERVDDLPESFWPSFTLGEPLPDGELPEGMIFTDEEGEMFRMTDGEAVEIDTVLEAEEEDVLDDHAVSVDDIEARLGVALALVRVDAEQAIEVLKDVLEKLEAIDVDEDDELDPDAFEDLDEIDEDDAHDAQEAIDDAKEEIARAETEIAEAEAEGDDVTAAKASLELAKHHMSLAEEAFAAGDYEASEEHADEAKHEAMYARGKYIRELDEDEDGVEDDEDELIEEEDDEDEDGDEDEDIDEDDAEDDEDEDTDESGDDSDNSGSGD